ncbi:conserved hypothetical protein [Parafrankia sp. EUN1f]|nr:conserved hypothetical protein [Parafrankia sp. EUN1f]
MPRSGVYDSGPSRRARRGSPISKGVRGTGYTSRFRSASTAPRARGRLRSSFPNGSNAGKTPACAGTTCRHGRPRPCGREDPRVRGDDAFGLPRRAGPAGRPPRARDDPAWERANDPTRGRPPRARGRPAHAARGELDEGKTPACAGTTGPRTRPATPGSEDPRVRGDDNEDEGAGFGDDGRPPRARGPRHGRGGGAGRGGKTPACAGTTSSADGMFPHHGEDPRVRGDDLAGVSGARPGTGRPPRARGRHHVLAGYAGRQGKTPACAGTTLTRARLAPRRAEDPRVRGDDTC